MLTHKDGSMGIVDEIAGKVGNLGDDLSCHFSVPLRRDQDAETGGSKQGYDELPGPGYVPWPAHDPGVSRHPEELIQDIPGGVPGIGSTALTFKPGQTGAMKR